MYAIEPYYDYNQNYDPMKYSLVKLLYKYVDLSPPTFEGVITTHSIGISMGQERVENLAD